MYFCMSLVLFCKNVFATVSSSHVYCDVKVHGGAALNLAVLKLIFSAWVRLIYLLMRVYQVAVTKNNNLNKMKKRLNTLLHYVTAIKTAQHDKLYAECFPE